MKNAKKILALVLVAMLSVGVLASCGEGESPEDTTAPTETQPSEGGETQPAETEPEDTEPVFDPAPIVDNTFGVANSTLVAFLDFEGTDATLNVFTGNEDKSVSGAYTLDAEKLVIGDTEFTYKLIGTFLTLETGDVKYQLTKSTEETEANYKGAYMLLTNAWSGDGASLSFDGANATIVIDGTEVNYTGAYTLDSATSLTVKDTSSGDPTNLALDCETEWSSIEAGDAYPGNLAVDGDTSTRWSSDYVDPSSLIVDLGAVKSVGGVRISFEAAYSIEYAVSVSTDKENWTEVVRVTDNATSGQDVFIDHSFDATDAQYVKFEGFSRATTYGHSLYEFEVYEKLLGVASTTLAYDGETVALTYGDTTYNLTK